ncbi:MAG: hypothetical protein ACON49_06500 [Candidatus Puniceispirillaceae bacterium]
MQYSIQRLKKVVNSSPILRIDPDFFHPTYLAVENKLSDISTSSMFQKGVKVIHPNEIKRNFVSENGVQFVRAQNVRPFFFNTNANPVFISKPDSKRLSKNVITHGDILLTRTGANFGQCCLYIEEVESTASSHTFIIKSGTIEPAFLVVLLNTTYGRQILDKNMYGAAQQELAPYAIYNFPAPDFTKDFEWKIASLFVDANELLNQSKKYPQQAETLLLTELGLENWQPKKQLSFVANYAEVEDANRFDADYFQPHYKELLERISEQQVKLHHFGEKVQLRNKNYRPIAEKEYRYIELSNIGANGEITGFSKELGKKLPSRARRIVRKGDVIISSIEGSIDSVALISDKEDGALCSTGFHIAHSEIYNPETLLVLMKSIIGQLQLERGCNGTILTSISKGELNRLKLPEINEATQEQLKQLVQQMYDDRDATKRLLETAKRAVEIAIEEDEVAAFRFIENEAT